MVELRLVGLSQDRQRLVLAGPSGQEFTVPVDDRLRAALRGDRARLGQLEIQMDSAQTDSALRPRDIQARIRAGESPDDVAHVAQVPVDKIMGYAVPVLAEREHIALSAQRSAVRRKGADGPARLLGDAVADRLRSREVEPETARWDAWRRDDGKWTVTVTHAAYERERVATFVFDVLGRYTVSEDDDARWLVGEPTTKQPSLTRQSRRLAAVSDTEEDDSLPFDEDDELTAVADAVRDEQAEATEDEGSVPEPELEEAAAEPEPAAADAAGVVESESADEPKRRGRKSRGRASVPSWDEIMFGRTKE